MVAAGGVDCVAQSDVDGVFLGVVFDGVFQGTQRPFQAVEPLDGAVGLLRLFQGNGQCGAELRFAFFEFLDGGDGFLELDPGVGRAPFGPVGFALRAAHARSSWSRLPIGEYLSVAGIPSR